MRALIVAASLMTVLAASSARGDEFPPPAAPRGAAYIDADSGTMTVIADKTAVMIAPDAKAKVVGTLNNGEQVTVYDATEKWVHIHSKSTNLDGYIQKSMLQ